MWDIISPEFPKLPINLETENLFMKTTIKFIYLYDADGCRLLTNLFPFGG